MNILLSYIMKYSQ